MPEFAIRVSSLDQLFNEFDARPVPERPLVDAVHDHLLDEWERVRDSDPRTLFVYAPEAERSKRTRRRSARRSATTCARRAGRCAAPARCRAASGSAW